MGAERFSLLGMGSLQNGSGKKMGQKITLGQARAGGGTKLTIHCMNHAVQYGGCFHSADMPLLLAISLWGGERRLDELPLKCSRCDSRKVDVRSDHPRHTEQSDFLHDLLNGWRARNGPANDR